MTETAAIRMHRSDRRVAAPSPPAPAGLSGVDHEGPAVPPRRMQRWVWPTFAAMLAVIWAIGVFLSLTRFYSREGYWSLLALAMSPVEALAVIWLVIARRLARADDRRAAGFCPECGYDLRGNVSGTCPECGRLMD